MIFLTAVVDLGSGKVGTREIAASGGSPLPELVRHIVSMQLLLAVVVSGWSARQFFLLSVDPTLNAAYPRLLD